MKNKIFITLFYHPGCHFHNTSTRKVASEKRAHDKAFADKYCYRYELSRRENIVDGKKTHKSKRKVYKKVVFGEIYTREQVMRMKEAGIVNNLFLYMEINGYEKVVKTRCGKWQDWEEDVEYVSEQSPMTTVAE